MRIPKVSFSNHFRARARGFPSFRGENTETLRKPQSLVAINHSALGTKRSALLHEVGQVLVNDTVALLDGVVARKDRVKLRG